MGRLRQNMGGLGGKWGPWRVEGIRSGWWGLCGVGRIRG